MEIESGSQLEMPGSGGKSSSHSSDDELFSDQSMESQDLNHEDEDPNQSCDLIIQVGSAEEEGLQSSYAMFKNKIDSYSDPWYDWLKQQENQMVQKLINGFDRTIAKAHALQHLIMTQMIQRRPREVTESYQDFALGVEDRYEKLISYIRNKIAKFVKTASAESDSLEKMAIDQNFDFSQNVSDYQAFLSELQEQARVFVRKCLRKCQSLSKKMSKALQKLQFDMIERFIPEKPWLKDAQWTICDTDSLGRQGQLWPEDLQWETQQLRRQAKQRLQVPEYSIGDSLQLQRQAEPMQEED